MCFNIFNSFIFNISVILILFLPEEIVRVLINTFNSDQSLHLLTSLIFIYAIATKSLNNFSPVIKMEKILFNMCSCCFASSDERLFIEPPERHWFKGLPLWDWGETQSLSLTHYHQAMRACCAIRDLFSFWTSMPSAARQRENREGWWDQ